MAGGVLSLCVVLLFVGVALSQTNSPPNVQGQWGDSACNLIPGSDQTYQIRTYFFSAVNTKTLGGTYELHQQLFHDASCSPTLEDARIIEKGSFTLGDRASLERFWNIDYTVTSRTLQVFSSTFASTVNSYVSCIFPSTVQVNVQQDISSVTCSELNINAISGCPVIYDIARRDVDTLFIGQRFPGHPPAYVPPCITVCRPSQYDRFSLAKAASATPTPAQPVLSPNPTPGNGVVFPIGDVVGPINLVRYSSSDVSSSSSSTTLAVSLVLLAIVQVLFL